MLRSERRGGARFRRRGDPVAAPPSSPTTCPRPPTRRFLIMVGDDRQVAMMLPVADLVHFDCRRFSQRFESSFSATARSAMTHCDARIPSVWPSPFGSASAPTMPLRVRRCACTHSPGAPTPPLPCAPPGSADFPGALVLTAHGLRTLTCPQNSTGSCATESIYF